MRQFNLLNVPELVDISIQLYNSKTGAYCFRIAKDDHCEKLIEDFEQYHNIQVTRFETKSFDVLCIVRAPYGLVSALVSILENYLNT